MVMTTVGSTGFNPYATTFTNDYLNQYAMGSNEDFMKQMYFPQDNTYVAQNPMFNLQAMQGQLAQDTFQKSSGRSKFADAATLAGLAGIGTTAGLYYLGGDYVNPFKDGIDDKLLKTLEDQNIAMKKAEELRLGKINEIVNSHITSEGTTITLKDISQYKAIEDVANGKPWPEHVKCPEAMKDLTTEQAKDIVAKVKDIKTKELLKQATRESTLQGSTKYLDELNARKSKLTALKSEITTEELAKHLKDNAKLYGITGADDAAIKAAAETKASKGLTELIAENGREITRQEEVVNNVRKGLKTQVEEVLDSSGKKLIKGAPENIQKAVSNFKFNKAGRAGLIAAGIAAIIGFVFGGSKS